jgi:hypothetical protein
MNKNHLFFAVGLVLMAWSNAVWACPFCTAIRETLSEQLDSMDAVVVAEMLPSPDAPTDAADPVATKARFKVIEVIKGADLFDAKQVIETVYFGDVAEKAGKPFLIMGVDPPKLAWSSPMLLNDQTKAYIRQLPKVPQEGWQRLAYFQNYLEDSEALLSDDAYNEFAKAPYATVIALKPKMDHDQLVSWIGDPKVSVSRRRLYLTMLGVCGDKHDLPFLEEMLRSDERAARSGLDAMVACYLTLAGAEGMPLIEELFLKNFDAEYADTYAAIMALRFHGSETDVIPRKRILEALHYVLERPQLADLVIPDLARWEDWSVMPRLVELFKTADDKTNWVRVPVINYLKACPKPEAQEHIKELEKIDPAAVKRANTFFPFGGAAPKG